MHNGSANGHAAVATPAGLTHDLLDRHRTYGSKFRWTVVVLGALVTDVQKRSRCSRIGAGGVR